MPLQASAYHLAQVNAGRIVDTIDNPALSGFVALGLPAPLACGPASTMNFATRSNCRRITSCASLRLSASSSVAACPATTTTAFYRYRFAAVG